MLATAWLAGTAVDRASALTTVNTAYFTLEFHDQGDGLFNGPGPDVANADLGTWTAAERDSVERAVRHWESRLGAVPGRLVVIRLAKDEAMGANQFGAQTSQQTFDAGGAPETNNRTNAYEIIANGNAAPPPNGDLGADANIIFRPGRVGGGIVPFDATAGATSTQTQFTPFQRSIEVLALREFARIFGMDTANEPYTNFVQGNTFTGNPPPPPASPPGEARTLFGDPGIPLVGGNNALTDVDYHPVSGAQPFGTNFQNFVHTTPVEHAIFEDLGYAVTEQDFVGQEFYQDGVVNLTSTDVLTDPASEYGIGVLIHADNVAVARTADITTTGRASTGVRISGPENAPNGNLFILDDVATIDVNGGDDAIGILVSAGANHQVRVGGNISATGTNGRGIVVDFGQDARPNNGTVTGADYAAVTVSQINVSGSIDAGTNSAIEVANTASVGTINFLNGATVTGNLTSDAATYLLVERPVIRFGDTEGVFVSVLGVRDDAFTMTIAGDITNVAGTGPGNFDLDFFGGQTTLSGTVNIVDTLVDTRMAANGLFATGTFTGQEFRVNSGIAQFTGLTDLGDVFIDSSLGLPSLLDANIAVVVNEEFRADSVTITGAMSTFRLRSDVGRVGPIINNGGVFEAGVGPTTGSGNALFATSVTQNGGNTAVTGTLDVTGNFTVNDGPVVVSPMGELDVAAVFSLNGPTTSLDVQNTAIFEAFNVINDQSRIDFDGMATILNDITTTAGIVDVGATGIVGVTGAYTQSSIGAAESSTTVAAGGSLTVGTYTSTNSPTTVMGTLTSNGAYTQIGNVFTLSPSGTFMADSVQITNGTAELDGTATVTNNYTATDSATNIGDGVNAAQLTLTNGNFSQTDDVLTVQTNAQLQLTNGNFSQTNSTTNLVGAGSVVSIGGTATQTGSMIDVNNGATFTSTGAFTQNTSGLMVDAGGTFNAGSVDSNLSTTIIDGIANVAGLFDLDGSGLTVNNGGVLNTVDFNQSQSQTTVAAGGAINATGSTTILPNTILDLNGTFSSNLFRLDAMATLRGNSTVTANNIIVNGLLSPGNSIGTQIYTGPTTFGPSWRLVAELDPTGTTPGVHNDTIIVNGNATVAGGTVQTSQIVPGDFNIGDQYTFLQATALTVTTPVTVQNVVSGVTFLPVFDATTYNLIIARSGSPGAVGRTRNQIAFGNYLSSVSSVPAIQTLLTNLSITPSVADVQRALAQLTGEIYGSGQTSQLQANSMFLDTLTSTIHGVGGCCVSFAEQPLPSGVWNTTYGWGGEDDTDGNAASADSSSWGTAVGYGRLISDSSVIGLFFGYENLNTDIISLDSSLNTETSRFGVYHESRFGSSYWRGIGAAGYSNNDGRRNIQFGTGAATVNERALSSYHTWHGLVDLETGWCSTLSQVKIEPFAGVRYIHLSQEGFSEQGAAFSALQVNSANLDSLRARAGVRLTGVLNNQNTFLSMDAFWQHDALGAPVGESTGALVLAPGGSYQIFGTQVAEGRFVFSPAIRQQLGDNVSMFFRYRGDYATTSFRNSGEGGMEVRW